MSYEAKEPLGTAPPTYVTEQQTQQQYQQPQQEQHQQPAPAQTQPQHAAPGTTHGIAPTGNVMPILALGSSPAPIQCPNCHQRAMTHVTPVVGNTTHAWALAACCFICLGCIPYLVSATKDIEHKCGNCGMRVATWHRSGRTDVTMV